MNIACKLMNTQSSTSYCNGRFSICVISFQDKLNYNDDFGDSDQEDEPDAYLARVKAEAKERDDDDDDDDDESTDEDFKPTQVNHSYF